MARLKKKIDINQDKERKPRRKKIKGVNPLAMKKKKNKTIGVAGKQVNRNEKVEQIYYIFFISSSICFLRPMHQN